MSVPAVGGEGIVCLHLRRKGHYLGQAMGFLGAAGANDRPRLVTRAARGPALC